MKSKWLAVGIILLFIGTCIIPFGTSEQTHGKNIITVDDEPGDADYTSIKEAVDHAHSGDIIEVYSGNYNESRINITQSNLTIQGIAHELGSGNDTGKPRIQANSYWGLFTIKNNSVQIDALNITRIGNCYLGIQVEAGTNSFISNCEFYEWIGCVCIWLQSSYNTVFNNTLSGPIDIEGMNNSICDNRILNAPIAGISIEGNGSNISYNFFSNCSKAIDYVSGANTTIIYNRIQNCTDGIVMGGNGPQIGILHNSIRMNDFRGNGCSILMYVSLRQPKMITQNNFVDNNRNVYIGWGNLMPTFLTWYNNYWDNWKGFGPKRIFSIARIPLFGGPYWEFFLFIPHTGAYDLHPAKEAYDIPAMK